MQETYKTEYFHDYCIKLTPNYTFLLDPSGKLVESYKFNGKIKDDERVLLAELIIAELLNITHPSKMVKPKRRVPKQDEGDFYIPFPEWFYRRIYLQPSRMATPMVSLAFNSFPFKF